MSTTVIIDLIWYPIIVLMWFNIFLMLTAMMRNFAFLDTEERLDIANEFFTARATFRARHIMDAMLGDDFLLHCVLTEEDKRLAAETLLNEQRAYMQRQAKEHAARCLAQKWGVER